MRASDQAASVHAGIWLTSSCAAYPPQPLTLCRTPMQTGPCSLCGAKSSVGWRRLPECAGEQAGDPACERRNGGGGRLLSGCATRVISSDHSVGAPARARVSWSAVWCVPCCWCAAMQAVGPAAHKRTAPLLNAGNACFVSVWKCHREDPGSMDAMLAARAALSTAPRPKRRRRGMKVRCLLV